MFSYLVFNVFIFPLIVAPSLHLNEMVRITKIPFVYYVD